LKTVEHFVNKIVSGLPINEHEKEDIKEELTNHLSDHIHESMIKGYTEDEAVIHAIETFGNERKLNWELKKTYFPYYKIARYVWNVFFVTAFLCLISYSTMEYYYPQYDNSLPAYSVITGFMIVAFVSGMGEIICESIAAEYKHKWYLNPWILFMVPSLIIGLVAMTNYFENPQHYQNGYFIDLFVIPISTFLYLFSRQLFTVFFVNNKNKLEKVN
jgi:hypothetical protein